jgi:hypothetical protein
MALGEVALALHVYFYESNFGDLQLPPDDETYFTKLPKPSREGEKWDRREANTLEEVDRLQSRLQRQTYERQHREWEHDDQAFAAARQKVIDSLHSKLASSATSEYEREFIRFYIQLREEKRAKYRQRFICDRAFLELRENDRARNPEETLGESL